MKLFFHKWYVFFISVYNIVKAIYVATDKIAAVRVELVSHKDLDDLERAIEERMQEMRDQRKYGMTSEETPIPAKDLN